MFNIKKLAIAKTGTMPVRDAAGEPQFTDDGKALSITFHSPGTREFAKAKHAQEQRNSSRVMASMQGKAEGKQTADEKQIERAELLAAVTVSFNNFALEGGPKSGHELFKAVYSDIEIGHIADDAEKFLGERGNFKPGSLNA